MVSWLVAARAAGRWLLVGCVWLVGWQVFCRREFTLKCAGGVGGGRSAPPAAHQIPIKQVLAAKMRLRSADTFNRLIALLLAWLVPVLLLCCGSWPLLLWLLSLLLVLVAVVVGRSELEPPYKSLSRRSELELELEVVHPPLARSTHLAHRTRTRTRTRT